MVAVVVITEHEIVPGNCCMFIVPAVLGLNEHLSVIVVKANRGTIA
jgi:hypothetical protein